MLNHNEIYSLLDHFEKHGISHEPNKGLRKVLKYQDLLGRANIKEIHDFEKQIGRYKKLFIWANLLCLGIDQGLAILRDTVIHNLVEESTEHLGTEIAKLSSEVAKLKAQREHFKSTIKALID